MNRKAVATYHALFVDVRGPLNASDYVANVVIGRKDCVGLTPGDVDGLMKHCGYCGGPDALDTLLRYVRDPPAALADLSTVDDAQLHELGLLLRVKASVLALGIRAHETEAGESFRLACEFGRLNTGFAEPLSEARAVSATPLKPPAPSAASEEAEAA